MLFSEERCNLVSNIQELELSTRQGAPSLSDSVLDVVLGKDEVYVRKKTANVETHDLFDFPSCIGVIHVVWQV